MSTRTLVIALLFALIWAAASAGCHTYTVYRGARVPRTVPTARTGQPMGNLAEAGLMAQTVAEASAPTLGDDAAGVHVPRHQGRAELRLRVPRTRFDVALLYERGLEAGSHALAKGSPAPEGDVAGAGYALYYSVAIPESPWSIGLGTEMLLYGIPFVEYRICDTCPSPYVVEDQDIVIRFVGSLSITPSYRVDDHWAVFGGLSVRNHPTVPRTGIEGDIDLGEEVDSGPGNILAAGGVEYIHPSGVRASLHLYQSLTGNPVQYFPTVGVAIALPLWRQPAGAVAPPPPPAPVHAPPGALPPGALP